MAPGSVIVDLAAETGGNCELTTPGENVQHGGVTVAGPLNLASSGAVHASEMYARNLLNFVSLFLKDGAIALDWNDELIEKSCWVRAPAATDETGVKAGLEQFREAGFEHVVAQVPLDLPDTAARVAWVEKLARWGKVRA